MSTSHRYVIRIRTTEPPASFRSFIDSAREAGVISAYEDGSGARLVINEIKGIEQYTRNGPDALTSDIENSEDQ